MSLADNQAAQLDTVRTMADNYFKEKITKENALKDGRVSINLEYDGREHPRYVVRFCGDYERGFSEFKDAKKYAENLLKNIKGGLL